VQHRVAVCGAVSRTGSRVLSVRARITTTTAALIIFMPNRLSWQTISAN
jgi:hypothetical protein